ncbi:MAG: PGF-pre-PGF domain-containing protein [Candidatus Aenigmatarchaeota archaeon]
MRNMKNWFFTLLLLTIFSLAIFSFVKALVSSTSGEFSLQPETIYLNWTNSYKTNLTVNSTFNVTLIFNNSTAVIANYSQGEGIELILINHTGNLSNITTINTSESNFSNFTIIASVQDRMPGKYKGNFFVENITNSSENVSITVIVDLPIEINSSTGIGKFNGTLPVNAVEYHSFYFNCSTLPNATSITVNISFDAGDVDLFLLANNELKAKSINKGGNEERLSYSFINPNSTYEIRIYGNHSSEISYNGTVILFALGSSPEEINFGLQNITNITKVFNLTNKGNISIQSVSEESELYYLKEFIDSGSKNFTFFLPNSSVFERIKVRLIWSGVGAYNISLFNSSGEFVNSSSGKYVNANMSNLEKEEFVEVDNAGKAGWWRVEVKNTTVNFSEYKLLIQAFVNPSKWIITNFSSYENKTFDAVGCENSTKTIEINLTIPADAISGRYEGNLIYLGENGGQLKIPIRLNLTNFLNITIVELVNESVNVSSQEGYVSVVFDISYVDGVSIPLDFPFNFTQNMSVWLYEPNASYSTGTLAFTNVSNGTHRKINITVPQKTPGGRYYVHIKLGSDIYRGESLDDPINKLLTIDDTGLNMSLVSYPSTLNKNSTGYVNVTIKNLGPIDAVNTSIKLTKGSCLSAAYFYLSNCLKYPNPGEEVFFNISAYNYTGCYIAWRIVAGDAEGSCTSWINKTSGTWFRNISFDTTITAPETTTTTLPPTPNITTTTTTTTTTTSTTTTTTTLPPLIMPINASFQIQSITPESPAVVEIPNANILKIVKITIFVSKNVSNATLTVKEGVKPENIPATVRTEEGLVHKYLEIVTTNMNESDVISVSIDFQVEKSWISENNIDVNTIALYRLSNNTWRKLQTIKINETSEYYQFRAISPGLSLFAIAGNWTKGFPIWIILVIVGAIVGGILAFLFWPVEEEKPIVQTKKEEEEVKRTWDELKKKWEELTKKKAK